MEENKSEEQVEILDEKPTEPVGEEPKKDNNKNSAVLIFAILGGLIFMLMVIVCIVILPGLIKGNGTTTKKAGADAEETYST